METFTVGQKVYIVENNRSVREAVIQRKTSGLFLIKFSDGSGTQVRAHRLFANKEDAQKSLPPEYQQIKHTCFLSYI